MIRDRPIRIRLMIWYSIVLAVSLVTFGVVISLGLRGSLISSRESALDQEARGLFSSFVNLDHGRSLNVDHMKEELGEFSAALPADSVIRVLDRSGAVLFQSRATPSGRLLQKSTPFRASGQDCRLEIAMSLASVDEILHRLNRILLLSIPLVLLIASAGGYWMSHRALAPVRRMAEAARSIGSADLSVRLPVPDAKDELRLLSETWNGMLGRLEEGIEKIRQFTADASHELRTPISTIRAAAEISLRRARTSEEYQETLRSILRQTERTTGLVEDLLTLARADAQKTELTLEPVDLRCLLENTCDALKPLAQAKNLDLRWALPSEPVWVRADSAALQHLAVILIDNAVQNTSVGGIDVRLAPVGDSVRLDVKDTGHGISPEDLPHIFDRFYRGDKSRNSATGGSGLGLAIAKWIVESHLGSISVKSEPPRGTDFSVRLPRLQSAADLPVG